MSPERVFEIARARFPTANRISISGQSISVGGSVVCPISISGEMIDWPEGQREFPVYYMLQNCTAGYVGNSPVFWAESDSGYTQWIDEAKWWTKEEAEQQIQSTRGTHTWHMWTVNEIRRSSKRTVDIQDLRKLAGGETDE